MNIALLPGDGIGPKIRNWIAIGCLGTIALTAYAGDKRPTADLTKPQYSVVQGKGWSVCESYARFLNSQPADEPLPSCHLKLSPSLKEPNWQELGVQSSLDVIYTLEYPPYRSSLNPDKPPPPFADWKAAFERELAGGRAPRLRRTHLALVAGGPEETVLAYEANRNDCDDEVKRRGYSDWGHGTRLFLWDDRQHNINDYGSALAFPPAHTRLLLYRGAPFMFMTWWGDILERPYNKVHVGGRIGVYQVVSLPSGGEPYGRKEVCQIGFALPAGIVERMIK
jgi:hypothetical protein